MSTGQQQTNITPDQFKQVADRLKIENQFKGGASWFHWIAGLSIVNLLTLLLGARWTFFVGLGTTQVVAGLPWH